MRKTRSITLITLAAASAVALAGCGRDEQQDKTYNDGEQTEAVGNMFTDPAACQQMYSMEECQAKANEAGKIHEAVAPHFATVEECRDKMGQCVTTNVGPNGEKAADGQSWFIPAMTGFIIGQALSSPQPVYSPYGMDAQRRCANSPNDPSCRTVSRGYAYSGGGGTVMPRAGGVGGGAVVVIPRSAPTYSYSGGTVSRGGFTSTSGVSSVSRGGFGASASAHAGGGGS